MGYRRFWEVNCISEAKVLYDYLSIDSEKNFGISRIARNRSDGYKCQYLAFFKPIPRRKSSPINHKLLDRMAPERYPKGVSHRQPDQPLEPGF